MPESIIDTSDMHGAIYAFPEQLDQAMAIGTSIVLNKKYENVNGIVVAGMGGSAIGGDVTRVLVSSELKIPMAVSRDYALPNWADKNTVVICSSYSGNTEETLSAFADAIKKQCYIIGISTGGSLTERLNENGLDVVKIPSGLQPRAALAFSFVPMLYILKNIGIIESDFESVLASAVGLLKEQRDLWGSESNENQSRSIAKKIYNTLPILYSDSDLSEVAAIRLKGQLNENANMHAWCSRLPELNHNEIVGWENNKGILKQISLIWMTDHHCHNKTKSRRNITSEIIRKFPANEVVLNAENETSVGQLLELIHKGDWISYWCALEHGTDPTPVDKIDQLKNALSKLN
ncbi:MAG: bifunctional phosphoglucose/phosphomannose isomerase [Candidatus Marinimicrobia bacterium]|jgi:glucose/mannose-6-phosphate isomerase|nr:bifunctional phosphoglucose/phosphomannose isomerase [Candidatus Neomarinimicrobiota bacterium]MDP6789197.1 bifunctional phosphoglucose/phosphomannose isomerase [Candidatus Neomarinimicrobiota bacterium]MDP7072610.1 bifunctional phosphoglucose/phosphomannose isomerase [Candidatus Neomarinimicrobiota bacterium]